MTFVGTGYAASTIRNVVENLTVIVRTTTGIITSWMDPIEHKTEAVANAVNYAANTLLHNMTADLESLKNNTHPPTDV
jgi:hypothetical protein